MDKIWKKGRKRDVMVLTDVPQDATAIARRMGYNKKIIIGDKSKANAENITRTMNETSMS